MARRLARMLQEREVRFLASCGIAGPIVFGVCLSVAGSLTPGYDQIRDYISPLGIGPYAVIQNVNFIVVGALIVGLVLGLHATVNEGIGSKTGPALMILSAVAFSLLGIFTTCNSWCTSGIIHDALFFVVIGGAVIGLPILARRLKMDSRWRPYAGYSIGTAVVSIVGLVAILLLATTDTKTLLPTGPLGPWAGLLQKTLAGTFLLWVEVMAIRLLTMTGRTGIVIR